MKNFLIRMLIGTLAFTILGFSAQAQVLDSENKVGITLSDGMQVICYGRANTASSSSYSKFSNEYYYLPTNLRLSEREDGTPEFLFVKYTTEERVDQGGVQGALMHFLMEWGLSPQQEQELQQKIKAKLANLKNVNPKYEEVKDPRVLGPAMLRSDTKESFRIVSGTLTSDQFTPNMVTTGRASLLPGSKMAVAAILEKNGAQLLASTFEKTRSITDVSIDLRFQYEVLTPAVDGLITVDWEKVGSMYQNYTRDYQHRDVDDETMPASNSLKDDVITDTEMEVIMEYLKETKAVVIKLDQLKPDDPIAQEVTQAFMEYFVASVAEKQYQQPEEGRAVDPLKPADPYQPPEDLYEYHFSSTRIQSKVQKGIETYNLKLRIPVVQEMTITENLASWYDGVKHNRRCVTSVNLNDPFFQHRDIHMILDREAERIFEEEANYVTVNIRKRRSDGNPFEGSILIDRKHLESQGVRASLSYARGEDRNPDVYEYKMQWSLKGGERYPESPDWQQGDWKGITLVPPISPRTVEFEGDLEQMKEMGIRRATLQLRYQKYGKEFQTNIPMTVSKGQALVEQTIFTDRDTRGYAYRLVLTHEKEGKLVLPWEQKINDDYVFALIPDELNNKSSDIFQKAVEMARDISVSKEGEISVGDNILDRFKEIFEIISE